jgi:hypothetical protein
MCKTQQATNVKSKLNYIQRNDAAACSNVAQVFISKKIILGIAER